MTSFSLKLGFLLIGLATWFVGYRSDNGPLRWIGIAFLAIAFLLRFVGRRPPADHTDESGGRGE